jgi:Uma2 family endonuclease
MVMPQVDRIWTRQEVLDLPPDGNRYELIDGQLLVSPSPRPAHQFAVFALYDLVAPYVNHHRVGITIASPADLDLATGQLSQPDLFVLPPLADGMVRDWAEAGIPLLIAEVVSPSTARYDRVVKRRSYQAAGIDTYWIVDLDASLVEVWRPEADQPLIADRILEWQPDATIPPLEINLENYFRPEWRNPP